MAGEPVYGRHGGARHAVADNPGDRASGAAERSVVGVRSLVERLLDEGADDRLFDWGWGDPPADRASADRESLHDIPELWAPEPARADHPSAERAAGRSGFDAGFEAEFGPEPAVDRDLEHHAEDPVDDRDPVERARGDGPRGDTADTADTGVERCDPVDGPPDTSTSRSGPLSIFDELFGPDRSSSGLRAADALEAARRASFDRRWAPEPDLFDHELLGAGSSETVGPDADLTEYEAVGEHPAHDDVPSGNGRYGDVVDGSDPGPVAWNGGAADRSVSNGSGPNGSGLERRAPNGRVSNGGTLDHMAPDGNTSNGSTPNGSTPNGSTPNGSTSNGSTPDGSALNHSAPYGSAPNGSAANGSAPNGSAPNGSAANGSAPNGSAPNGSAANGSAANGSAPNGSTANRRTENGGARDHGAQNPGGPSSSRFEEAPESGRRLRPVESDGPTGRGPADRNVGDRNVGDRNVGDRFDGDRFDGDWFDANPSDRDRYEGAPFDEERFDGDRRDRFEGDRFEGDRLEGDRSEGDRFDGNWFDPIDRGRPERGRLGDAPLDEQPFGTPTNRSAPPPFADDGLDDGRNAADRLGSAPTERAPFVDDLTPRPLEDRPHSRDARTRDDRDGFAAAPFDGRRPGPDGFVADRSDQAETPRNGADRLFAEQDNDPGGDDRSAGWGDAARPGDVRAPADERHPLADVIPHTRGASHRTGSDPVDPGPGPTSVLNVVPPTAAPTAEASPGRSRRGPAEQQAAASRRLEEYTARRRAAEQAAASAEAAAAAAAERASAAIAAAARAADEAEAAAEAAGQAADEAQEAVEAEERALADAGAHDGKPEPAVRGGETGTSYGAGPGDDAESPTQAVPLVPPAPAVSVPPAPGRPVGPPPRGTRPEGPGAPGPARGRAAHRAGTPRDDRDEQATAVLTGLHGLHEPPPARGRGASPAESPAEVTSLGERPLDLGDDEEPEPPAPPAPRGLAGRFTSRPVLAAVVVAVVLAVAALVVLWTTSGSASAPPASAQPTGTAPAHTAASSPPAPAIDPESEEAVAFLTALDDADIPTSGSGQAETEAAAAICAQLDEGAAESQLERSVPAVLPDVSRDEAGEVVALAQEHYC